MAITHFIHTTGKELNIQSNQGVMIAIAWVLSNEEYVLLCFLKLL